MSEIIIDGFAADKPTGTLRDIFGDPFKDFSEMQAAKKKNQWQEIEIDLNPEPNAMVAQANKPRPKGIGEDWFRNLLRSGLQRAQASTESNAVEIEMQFKAASALELSTMGNLAAMLEEYMPDWTVKYVRCEAPVDLRSFFEKGAVYDRATYHMFRYNDSFFIHVDFKENVEVYVVQKNLEEVVRRKLYMVGRPDSLKLFRIITDELETITNGYQESEAD